MKLLQYTVKVILDCATNHRLIVLPTFIRGEEVKVIVYSLKQLP